MALIRRLLLAPGDARRERLENQRRCVIASFLRPLIPSQSDSELRLILL